MDIALLDPVIQDILLIDKQITAIVLWGSKVNEHDMTHGDVDILLFRNDNEGIEKFMQNIYRIQQRYLNQFELDPMIVLDSEKYKVQSFLGDRQFHLLELWQIKNISKVIWGDPMVLKLFPDIYFKDALMDVAKYIQEVLIPQIKLDLETTSGQNAFTKNWEKMLVIARTIYGMRLNKLDNKIKVCEYLSVYFPQLSVICKSLTIMYLKSTKDFLVTQNEIESLISVFKNQFQNYCANN